MAKIDVTQIEGYEEMSDEEKIKALLDFDMPDPDYSGYVKKDQFDKTASELAGVKKQLRETMTAEELAAKEREEKEQALQSQLETLQRESEISKNKANLISLGYEEAFAEETATAMYEGDTAKVFANQKKHQELLEKKVKAEVLKGTPKPGGDGGSVDVMTLDKLRKLSPADRLAYSQKHPDEYKELYGGN